MRLKSEHRLKCPVSDSEQNGAHQSANQEQYGLPLRGHPHSSERPPPMLGDTKPSFSIDTKIYTLESQWVLAGVRTTVTPFHHG